MCKKLFLLICFLVLSLAVAVRAEDLEVPLFAGCSQSGAAFWEFDVEYPEASDFLYFPDVADPCVTIDDVECTGTGITWNEGSQSVSVNMNELNIYMPPPAGTGSSVTIQCQVTYTGAEADVSTGLEVWDGLRCEGGEFLDGLEAAELDFYEAVELAPGLWHTTSSHTFDVPEGFAYVSAILFITEEYGGSGSSDVHEVVLDAVIHDGTPPEGCPKTGRPFGSVRGVSNPSPADEEKHVDPSTNLSFQAPTNALCMWEDDPNDPNDKPPDPNLEGPLDYDVYFGTEPNVLTMTQLADGYEPANCNDVMVFDPCTSGDLNLATKYYWRVDFNDANGGGDPCFYEGPYFSFSTLGLAGIVAPADGAGEEAVYGTSLRWAGDVWADTFDVYFSTDFDDVDNGIALVGDNQGPNTYNPGTLVLDTEYFWRIDEVNGIALKGDVWSFTTDISTVVDNMDSYAEYVKEIYDTWLDYHDLSTRSEVLLETTTVQDGNSMSLRFNNTLKAVPGNIYGSWTTASVSDLVVGSDWGEIGAKALSLAFYGDPGNIVGPDDKMYIVLEDASANVGISYYPDVNNVKIAQWREWNIDLEDFNSVGVDLSNVSKISIGFGTYGGSPTPGIGVGTVYIDNILLWASRCVREFAPGDVDGDCEVTIWDLEDMSFDWLVSDYLVPPQEPNRDNLLVEYLFTTGLEDTSGAPTYDGIDGDGSGTAVRVANGYLTIVPGIGDVYHVEIPLGTDNPFDGSQDFSISMKFRSDVIEVPQTLISSSDPDVNNPDDPNHTNTHPMAVYSLLEPPAGTGSEDYLAATYDNWFLGASGAEIEGVGLIGEWQHVAVTYDADGGLCPDDADPNICPPGTPTGFFMVYINGIPGWEGEFDPNIPEIDDDKVLIGDTASPAQKADLELSAHNGDIDEVRIYTSALSHSNVMWLAGIAEPTHFLLESPANLYPKVGPFGFDPNNLDIVNFQDYAILANNWLAEEVLWP